MSDDEEQDEAVGYQAGRVEHREDGTRVLYDLVETDRYINLPVEHPWARWADQLQPLQDAFTAMGQAAWDATSGLRRLAAELDHDTPPTDPRARALWLREHRNTGPTTRPLNQRRRTR